MLKTMDPVLEMKSPVVFRKQKVKMHVKYVSEEKTNINIGDKKQQIYMILPL